MSLISAAVCVGVMFVMSTLETRAVWAMAGRGKLRHGINFRFVAELRLQVQHQQAESSVSSYMAYMQYEL